MELAEPRPRVPCIQRGAAPDPTYQAWQSGTGAQSLPKMPTVGAAKVVGWVTLRICRPDACNSAWTRSSPPMAASSISTAMGSPCHSEEITGDHEVAHCRVG